MEKHEKNEAKQKHVFFRLILSYAILGVVISLAAIVGIRSIDDELSATPIVYEQALYDLHAIEASSDRGAQALYAYLLTGVQEELIEYRRTVETLPTKFDAFASSAFLSTTQEESQRIRFDAIKKSWANFTRFAEVIVGEYNRAGTVSVDKLLSIEKSLAEYHGQVNFLIEYEHTKSQESRLSLNKIIDNYQLLSLVTALIGLAALILIATLMAKQVNRFMTNQNNLLDDLRQHGAQLLFAQQQSDLIAEELTQFIDSANAPIFGIDANGLINEWNQKTANITGYPKEDVLGQDLVQHFVTEDYRAAVQEVLQFALQGIETSNYEFPLYTKEGARIDVLLNATTRRDMDSNITGVIGVGQDITEVKAAQAALQQSQRLEVVGQLTGGVAHDFNNLLTVITGNLSFLKGELGVMSSDVTDIINDAQSAARDGAELTHRLLAFARQQVLEPKATSANDLIADTSRLMRRALGEDISITTVLDTKNPIVMVDQGQLESALMNLCINARDAMQAGGSLKILSETKSLSQNQAEEIGDLAAGKYVIITVADSGSGMSKNEIGQVFEPFYTTKEPGKGSGLGLSMVHGFVIQSQGTVVIESKLGTGTDVKLYLPDVTGNEDNFASTVETTFSERLPSGTEKILIVDDEPRVRKTAVRILRKLGYEVIEANSGEEALALLKKNKDIDLLFSDIMMPGGMNGRQLASIVNTEYPKIQIQLTSGYENVDVTKNSTDFDFPLLRKPYGQEDLATALRILLDRS